MRRKRVAVFGSTGSIGRATLEVLDHLKDRFELISIAARSSNRTLYSQARRFRPKHVVLSHWPAYQRARDRLGGDCEISWGLGRLVDIARSRSVDIVVMAMSGTSGLLPVLAALERQKTVALATKEILVGFGEQVMRAVRRSGGVILPIDSELSAIHQCLGRTPTAQVRRVVLTASGGPFWRNGPPRQAAVDQVLRHPTWNMGRKITVDSATLMNKGLEAIETTRLFDLSPDKVDAVVHPQSVVHSMIEFVDGSVLAQLSEPDMRLPIQYCLTWPDRVKSLTRRLDLTRVSRLDFHPIPERRFPCYRLARRALETGRGAPCVMNAANQVGVDAYLAGRIVFGDIPRIIENVVNEYLKQPGGRARNPGIRSLLRLEGWAASSARSLILSRMSRRKGPAG